MAYCTYTDVQSEFKDITFSASTAVTDTEVTTKIAEVDGEINARLGVRYSVPVTGAISLVLLRAISIFLTAARISKIIEVKTGESDKDTPRRVEERNTALKMLQEIIDGKLLLSDATAISTHRGVRGYTYENDITPLFDVASESW